MPGPDHPRPAGRAAADPAGGEQPGSGGERRGDDGGVEAQGVSEDSGDEGVGNVADVAPEPVGVEGVGPPDRVGVVGRRRDQRRIHHRGAQAEQDRGQHPGEERMVEQGERGDQPGGLHEHAGDDERFATGAVGEVSGRDLPEAPQ
ncbi:hypothetical protein Drose_24535 [Dactylosporangium roseum]|uniref:Uncharacterized protein n=1 Tax=Dactylosporangium roseum TaxID=47989 RepID=A0ABY5ZFM4_9ACTN|nr:hypothetical protein [Dactylosporangium roseum]UWZ40841.1 hypothetical protein Drose_24535 [Dactylosporangium roseum]